MSNPIHKVRAKFTVQSVTPAQDPSQGSQVALGTVAHDQNEENKKFFALTPSGQIQMGIVAPETASFFVPGQEYYVDFTLAHAAPAQPPAEPAAPGDPAPADTVPAST